MGAPVGPLLLDMLIGVTVAAVRAGLGFLTPEPPRVGRDPVPLRLALELARARAAS